MRSALLFELENIFARDTQYRARLRPRDVPLYPTHVFLHEFFDSPHSEAERRRYGESAIRMHRKPQRPRSHASFERIGGIHSSTESSLKAPQM